MQQCTTNVSVIFVDTENKQRLLYNIVNCRYNKHNTTQVRDRVVDENKKTPLQMYHMLQAEMPCFKEFRY